MYTRLVKSTLDHLHLLYVIYSESLTLSFFLLVYMKINFNIYLCHVENTGRRITFVNCSCLLQITTPPWFTGNNYYLLPQIEDLVLEESSPTSSNNANLYQERSVYACS